jgi:hypothetical protein
MLPVNSLEVMIAMTMPTGTQELSKTEIVSREFWELNILGLACVR